MGCDPRYLSSSFSLSAPPDADDGFFFFFLFLDAVLGKMTLGFSASNLTISSSVMEYSLSYRFMSIGIPVAITVPFGSSRRVLLNCATNSAKRDEMLIH